MWSKVLFFLSFTVTVFSFTGKTSTLPQNFSLMSFCTGKWMWVFWLKTTKLYQIYDTALIKTLKSFWIITCEVACCRNTSSGIGISQGSAGLAYPPVTSMLPWRKKHTKFNGQRIWLDGYMLIILFKGTVYW